MRRRVSGVVMMAFALAAAASPAARAQEERAEPAPAQAAAQDAVGEAGSVVSPPSGLPRRAPEPRTMQGYWPVFAAFSVAWLGIVGYLVAIGRRSRRLARRLSDTEALP